MVTGLNIDKWYTLKAMNNDLDSEVVDEYLHGLVHDTLKFNNFIQVHLTIFEAIEILKYLII